MSRFLGVLCLVGAFCAIGVLEYALNLLVHIGPCSSGSHPYPNKPPCPSGTGWVIAMIPFSVLIGLGLTFGAAVTLGARAALLVWAALFVATGAQFFTVARAGGQIAVVFYFLSALFVGIGALPLFVPSRAFKNR